MTENEELALQALDMVLHQATVGFTDVGLARCLDAAEKFYEAIGYGWERKLDELDKLYNDLVSTLDVGQDDAEPTDAEREALGDHEGSGVTRTA